MKNKTRFLLVLIVVFSHAIDSYSTSIEKVIRFERITQEEELSHSSINCMIKDNNGYMWFATWNGLNRYDGYNFTVYKNNVNDTNSISNNGICTIFKDHNGTLWIGTNKGLNKYDHNTDRFIRFFHNPHDTTSLSHDIVTSICQDKDNNLWIGTLKGGFNKMIIDSMGNTIFKHYPLIHHQFINGSKTNTITASIAQMYIDNKNILWIGTYDAGLYKVHINNPQNRNMQITQYQKEYINREKGVIKNGSLEDMGILSITGDDEGYLWLGTNSQGIARFDKNSDVFSHFLSGNNNIEPLAINGVRCIYPGNGDILWIGAQQGLIKFNKRTKKYTQYQHDRYNPNSISDNIIHYIYKDQGMLWIGTSQGINKLNIDYHKVDHYKFDIEDNNISALYKDDKWLWISKSTGLYLVNWEDNKKDVLLQVPFNNTISSILAIHKSNTNTYWIGTNQGLVKMTIGGNLGTGYKQLTKKDFSFEYFYSNLTDPEWLNNYSIRSIAEDKKGNIWLATWGGGVNVYDIKTQKFKHIGYDKNTPNGLSDNRVRSIYVDKEGIIWIGTAEGLNKLVTNNDSGLLSQYKITTYKSDPNNPNSISDNHITSIFEGRSGLWIGTDLGGINRFDKNEEKFFPINESNGLVSNQIRAILEDTQNNLWLSTGKGISKINPKTLEIRNYLKDAGTMAGNFNAATVCNSGELFFGGEDGFNVLSPDHIKDNPFPPKVIITNFRLYNKEVPVGKYIDGRIILNKVISVTDEIKLSYNDDIFSFEFSGLHYDNPQRNKYAYKMQEGTPSGSSEDDDNWIYVNSDRRFVSFTKLPPGDYIFSVKAANSDGIWNEENTSLKIVISPPFWQTWWFRVLVVVFIIGFLYGYNKHRIYVFKKQNKALEKRVAERTFELQEANARLEEKQVEILSQKQKVEKMAQKVHEADQLKLRFFSNISHEFRTPLTLILDPIEKLISTGDSFSKKKRFEHYQLIKKNSSRLLRLVNQLLDIRKIETGSMKLQVAKGDIVEFVQFIFESFKQHAEQRNINYQFIIDDKLLKCNGTTSDTSLKVFLQNNVWFDHEKMEIVLFNLISNAFKYTPNRGTITVSISHASTYANKANQSEYKQTLATDSEVTSHELNQDIQTSNSKIQIKISDTGIGIPSENIPYIFDRFYQVNESKQGGTGIGLALTKELVELHYGEISVESEYGKGTVFTINLPTDHNIYSKQQIISAKSQLSTQKPTYKTNDYSLWHAGLDKNSDQEINNSQDLPMVLIVEDNNDLRNYLKADFSDKYNIELAKNGQIGWEKAIRDIPDLVISDVMMPELDGYSLCNKIKSDERTSHIPVILLTAKAADENKITGYITGADSYIEKPFNFKVLEAVVHNLIDSRKKLRNKFIKEIIVEPSQITVNSIDEEFLTKAIKLIEDNISDPDFDNNAFIKAMGISRTQLYKKMKALTDLSVGSFIKTIRLKRAAQLLLTSPLNIKEVAFSVGFKYHSYFTNCFIDQFGISPLEFSNQNKNTSSSG